MGRMRVSNVLMTTFNFVMVVLSIPIIVMGIWLATRGDTECLQFMQQPVMVTGIVMLVVSLLGFLGSSYRVAWVLWLYLFLMFLLVMLLLCFTIFAFIVTNSGGSHPVAGTNFSEHRLHDYSDWLQNKVEGAHNWRKIKHCLQDFGVCRGLGHLNEQAFMNASHSPLQVGCCKPPMSCAFAYENATTWIPFPPPPPGTKPDAASRAFDAIVGADPDCRTWSNDQDKLCFDCNSCRAGLLASIRRDWHKVAIFNAIVLALLIIDYSIGCCAFYNAKREGFYNRRGGIC